MKKNFFFKLLPLLSSCLIVFLISTINPPQGYGFLIPNVSISCLIYWSLRKDYHFGSLEVFLFGIINDFTFSTDITASFSSSFTIYETQYKATISEDDFNYSQNPTIISGSSNSGIYYNFATSSFFSPYVTTVGLYNENNELLVVGKLGQPIRTSDETDTTLVVRWDTLYV